MANDSYGSVSRCRVYVDYISYAKVQGMIDGYDSHKISTSPNSISEAFDFDPTKTKKYISSDTGGGNHPMQLRVRFKNYYDPNSYKQFSYLLRTFNYGGILGHTLGLKIDEIAMGISSSIGDQTINFINNSILGVKNGLGCSLFKINPEHIYDAERYGRYDFRLYNINNYFVEGEEISLGTFTLGRYFDLPVNANLSVNQTFSYDGVQTKRTFGGADLTQVNHTRKKWGDLGAWTHIDLSEYSNPSDALNNEDYSTAGFQGKRSWDLAWSFISKEDMFPMNFENNMSGYYSTQEELGDNIIVNGTMANFGAGYEGLELIEGTFEDSEDVAESWRSGYNVNVTVSKVTGNGSNGWAVGQTAQKLITTANNTKFHFYQYKNVSSLDIDKTYKYTFKYRSNSEVNVTGKKISVGYGNFGYLEDIELPINTGDAVTVNYYIRTTEDAHDSDFPWSSHKYVAFYAPSNTDSGQYLEVSDIEVREVITPAGTWFDGGDVDNGVHTDNIVGNFLNYTCFGTIPFIFQPDNTKTTFAICVLDKPSISIKRVAPDLYNIKMKIVEI